MQNLLQSNYNNENDDDAQLLIHSDTTNGSTVFEDTSLGNSIPTKFYKKGYFDGTDDYLTIADSSDWDFGSGDFTIDLWVNPKDVAGNYDALFGEWTGETTLSYTITTGIANKVTFHYSTNGTSSAPGLALTATTAMPVGSFTHIAVVRDTTTLRLFINGVQEDTYNIATDVINNSTFPIHIGQRAGTYFYGYLDEIRVSKGIARWTSGFTPPTNPYTSDANTQLLLHMDGEGETFIDDGNTGHTVTTNGNPKQLLGHMATPTGNTQHSTTQAKFGSTSIKFDGAGDVLVVPHSDDFELGSGIFTIDFWVYFAGTHSDFRFFMSKDNLASDRSFYIGTRGDGTIQFAYFTDGGASFGGIITATSLATDEWVHLALVRESSTSTKLYENGIQIGVTTANYTVWPSTTDTDLKMGLLNFNGYLDEVRFSKGIARWTSNFTPPTRPYAPLI